MRSSGKCQICGKPSVKRGYCQPHYEVVHAGVRRRQLERRAAGLCYCCDTPSGPYAYCEKHRAMRRNRRRRDGTS
jgi:hypothetical protein